MATAVSPKKEAQAAAKAESSSDAASMNPLTVKDTIEAGVATTFSVDNGTTPLMRAAMEGNLEVVRLLAERGTDLNVQRRDGFSALLLAVFFGHADVVRELLSCGADVTAESRPGSSAKVWAAARGFDEITSLVEAAGRRPREDSISASVEKSEVSPQRKSCLQVHQPSAPVLSPSSVLQNVVTHDLEITLETKPVDAYNLSAPATSTSRDSASSISHHQITKTDRFSPEFSSMAHTVRRGGSRLPRGSLTLLLLSGLTSSWKRLGVFTCLVMLFSALLGFAIVKAREAWLNLSPAKLSQTQAIQLPEHSRASGSSSQAQPDSVIRDAGNESAMLGVHVERKRTLSPLRSKHLDKIESARTSKTTGLTKGSAVPENNPFVGRERETSIADPSGTNAKRRKIIRASVPLAAPIRSPENSLAEPGKAKSDVQSKNSSAAATINRPGNTSLPVLTSPSSKTRDEAFPISSSSKKASAKVIQWP